MSKQLKPVKIRSTPLAVNYRAKMDKDFVFKDEIDYLILPLTPASRKRMETAMRIAMFKGISGVTDRECEYATAALAALEKMALKANALQAHTGEK